MVESVSETAVVVVDPNYEQEDYALVVSRGADQIFAIKGNGDIILRGKVIANDPEVFEIMLESSRFALEHIKAVKPRR